MGLGEAQQKQSSAAMRGAAARAKHPSSRWNRGTRAQRRARRSCVGLLARSAEHRIDFVHVGRNDFCYVRLRTFPDGHQHDLGLWAAKHCAYVAVGEENTSKRVRKQAGVQWFAGCETVHKRTRMVKCNDCGGAILRIHRRWWQRILLVRWTGSCEKCRRHVVLWTNPRSA